MDTRPTIENGAIQTPDITCIGNGTDLNSPIRKDLEYIEEEYKTNEDEDSQNFTIEITRKLKICIYKPLIPLKIALFLWYGAGATIATFLLVFLKQKGVTLSEISTVYILIPTVQFIGPTISGIVADKIGRSKPVLVFNFLFVVALAVSMLLAPSLNVNCDSQPVNLKCHPEEFGRLIAKTSCDVTTDVFQLTSCNVTCPENVTQYCHGQNLICELLEGNENFDNFSLSVHVSWAYKKSMCYYNVTSMSHKNTTYSWCNVPHKMYCRISCLIIPEEKCFEEDNGRTKILILNMVLLILFLTAFSNCYRFMDVTTMFLVKEHKSDFGRERFFAIAGILMFSPLIGYIVDQTSHDGTDKNYNIIFYIFIGLVFLLLLALIKLEVRIKSPGKSMWKKTFALFKNPDVIAFALVLFALGTAWGFTKNFTVLYLEEMKAPSFLLGLVNAASALYGLPFLLTSNWWVKKIGTTQIFILGLLGHMASGIGYSFLQDPWLSLLIEVTSIVTYHLLWVAVILHSHSFAPEGLTATVISTSGAFHFSIGKGSGGLIGGLIMDAFGGRIAYRVLAIICLTAAVLYAVYLYIRKSCFMGSHTLDMRNGPEESYPMRNKS